MTYLVYLDEFGHIGPFVSRRDPRHNDSPVFGLAGYAIPIDETRDFASWFYRRKCELLAFEIERSEEHPALWEKKGAALYTHRNVAKYAELRHFTNRLFNRIARVGGFVFHVGIEKTDAPERHNPNGMYRAILREAIKRLDDHCIQDRRGKENFLLILDDVEQRAQLITEAARSMYAAQQRREHLLEPPFHLESHRFQTLQAADWIAGLIGRLGAVWARPKEYPENELFRRYFEVRLANVSLRSGIRTLGAFPSHDE